MIYREDLSTNARFPVWEKNEFLMITDLVTDRSFEVATEHEFQQTHVTILEDGEALEVLTAPGIKGEGEVVGIATWFIRDLPEHS